MLDIQGWIVIGLIVVGCFLVWRCLDLLDQQNVLLRLLETSTGMKLDNLTSRVLDTKYQLKQIRIELRRSQGLDSSNAQLMESRRQARFNRVLQQSRLEAADMTGAKEYPL